MEQLKARNLFSLILAVVRVDATYGQGDSGSRDDSAKQRVLMITRSESVPMLDMLFGLIRIK